MVVFGDDVVWSVNHDLAATMNFGRIQQWMATLGHKLTPATKDDKEPTGEVGDVSFLKRRFQRQVAGIWEAPLEYGSITAPFCWTQLPPEDTEGWTNLMGETAKELCLHGKGKYDGFMAKLRAYQPTLMTKHPALARAVSAQLDRSYEAIRREYVEVSGLATM